jgi:hypothetical protein
VELADVKFMALRRDGECACGTALPKGTRAAWDKVRRVVICEVCLAEPELGAPAIVDIGVLGASLQREYERRMVARELRVTSAHPLIGGWLVRTFKPPHTTTAFATGAAGERKAAEVLTRKVGDSVLFLYNRRVGLGPERGDIDIIAVAPSGVFVIDPKKYAGRKVRRNRAGDAFVIDGRRRAGLAVSMRRHVDAVAIAVSEGPMPEIAVAGSYCFIGADLPLRQLAVDGVPALGLRGTVRMLKQRGFLDAGQRLILRADLARRFPAA